MKLSQIRCWKNYCSEPIDKIEHYEEALAEDFAGWCIHHRLEIQQDGTRVSAQELKDQGLYYDRPASELVFMRREEHTSLHNAGNTYIKGKHLSEKTRQKIAEANKGKQRSAETRQKIAEARKGMQFSAETRKKLSEARKGKPTWNKGKTSCYSKETLQKKSKSMTGKLWWTNGIQTKLLKECPGEGWTRGRFK